jgi:hypothetical protein
VLTAILNPGTKVEGRMHYTSVRDDLDFRQLSMEEYSRLLRLPYQCEEHAGTLGNPRRNEGEQNTETAAGRYLEIGPTDVLFSSLL